MLTVEMLAENHRLIYEAVRDAGKPIAPKEIERLTGLPGSTLRPTLGVMVEKGLLERPVYGRYTVVPLELVGNVLQSNESSSYIEAVGKIPYTTSGQQRMQPTSPSQRDDMHLPPEWLAPIVAGADAVLFDRSSSEHAAEAKMKGRRYRLRVELEADDAEPKQTDPLPPKE